jgi:hypothetical protein
MSSFFLIKINELSNPTILEIETIDIKYLFYIYVYAMPKEKK